LPHSTNSIAFDLALDPTEGSLVVAHAAGSALRDVPRLLKRCAIVAIVLLAGCASDDLDPQVIVRIDPTRIVEAGGSAASGAKVKVIDIRQRAVREKAALGLNFGNIKLDPPEEMLVRKIVEASLEQVLSEPSLADAPRPAVVYCGIRAFDITTPATPLYYDVTTHIEIVLRIGRAERSVRATAEERTYIYPTREIIGRVTTLALKDIASQTKQALSGLVAEQPR